MRMAKKGEMILMRDPWPRAFSWRAGYRAVLAVTAIGLVLGGCAATPGSQLLSGGTWPEELPKTNPAAPETAYPSFGAPAQVGDRPVLDAAGRQKMQSDLENLAQQRQTQMLKQIEDEAENAGQ